MSEERFRKLFIGGLEPSVTEAELKDYFQTYGSVTDCVVLRDRMTGRSRRFGFVTFDDRECVDQVQADRPHSFRGREVELRRAVPKQYFERLYGHLTVKKLFVGGIGDSVEVNDLRDYFSQYGNVRNVDVIVDRDTRRKRGFAFVEFDDYDPVDKIVLIEYHTINSKSIEVKKAMTRYETRLLKQAQNYRDRFDTDIRTPNMSGAANFIPTPASGYGSDILPGFGSTMFPPFRPVELIMSNRTRPRNFYMYGPRNF